MAVTGGTKKQKFLSTNKSRAGTIDFYPRQNKRDSDFLRLKPAGNKLISREITA